MSDVQETIDFGAPMGFGCHHFYVEIPPGSHEPVLIYEDFGFDSDNPEKQEITELRCELPRELWTKIRDDAKRDFNTRLKTQHQSTGAWNTGITKLERFLGKELCVLAWAAEHARPAECIIISQRWLALRPEERWWLYTKTAAEASKAEQKDRGWRKALYCCLSDGHNILTNAQKSKSKRLKLRKEKQQPTLFEM